MVTGIAKAVTMAETGLKEAAGVPGGTAGFLMGHWAVGLCGGQGCLSMGAEHLAPLAS